MGRSSNASGQGNTYEDYKEQAAKIAEQVSENAKLLKDKAMDWFASFS